MLAKCYFAWVRDWLLLYIYVYIFKWECVTHVFNMLIKGAGSISVRAFKGNVVNWTCPDSSKWIAMQK